MEDSRINIANTPPQDEATLALPEMAPFPTPHTHTPPAHAICKRLATGHPADEGTSLALAKDAPTHRLSADPTPNESAKHAPERTRTLQPQMPTPSSGPGCHEDGNGSSQVACVRQGTLE